MISLQRWQGSVSKLALYLLACLGEGPNQVVPICAADVNVDARVERPETARCKHRSEEHCYLGIGMTVQWDLC